VENSRVEKSAAFVVGELLDYLPHAVVIKTLIRKTTGNVSLMAFDCGEILVGKVSPFDTLIQIIDGKAEVLIDDASCLLDTGQSIIIPAGARNTIKANVRFKALSTSIKSGYEEVT